VSVDLGRMLDGCRSLGFAEVLARQGAPRRMVLAYLSAMAGKDTPRSSVASQPSTPRNILATDRSHWEFVRLLVADIPDLLGKDSVL
jgi:hypothetical protein